MPAVLKYTGPANLRGPIVKAVNACRPILEVTALGSEFIRPTYRVTRTNATAIRKHFGAVTRRYPHLAVCVVELVVSGKRVIMAKVMSLLSAKLFDRKWRAGKFGSGVIYNHLIREKTSKARPQYRYTSLSSHYNPRRATASNCRKQGLPVQ